MIGLSKGILYLCPAILESEGRMSLSSVRFLNGRGRSQRSCLETVLCRGQHAISSPTIAASGQHGSIAGNDS